MEQKFKGLRVYSKSLFLLLESPRGFEPLLSRLKSGTSWACKQKKPGMDLLGFV